MTMMQEFRDFAVKGNAIDLAVGVVIGAAFGKIVNSIVNDMLMPIVGLLSGGVDFKGRFIALDGGDYDSFEKAVEARAPVLGYGNLLQSMLEFVIVAFAIFLMVRSINRMRAAGEAKK